MNLRAMVQAVLPTFAGRIGVHHVGYIGNGEVQGAVPYATIANTPALIRQKLTLMKQCNVDLVISTWQGPWSNDDTILFGQLCSEFGMQHALLLDPGGMAKWLPNQSAATITANVIAALTAAMTTIINLPSYVPEKWVLDFATGAILSQVEAKFPMLDILQMRAGFSWPSIPDMSNPVSRNAASVADIKTQNSSSAMRLPGVCSCFNDAGETLPANAVTLVEWENNGCQVNYNIGAWGNNPCRILESYAGQLLQQMLAVTPPTAPAIMFVTWDDYRERSSGPLEKIAAETTPGFQWIT
jgi:hypothetical protein